MVHPQSALIQIRPNSRTLINSQGIPVSLLINLPAVVCLASAIETEHSQPTNPSHRFSASRSLSCPVAIESDGEEDGRIEPGRPHHQSARSLPLTSDVKHGPV